MRENYDSLPIRSKFIFIGSQGRDTFKNNESGKLKLYYGFIYTIYYIQILVSIVLTKWFFRKKKFKARLLIFKIQGIKKYDENINYSVVFNNI